MDTKKHYRNYWLLFAISGLVLIGFGLSLFGEALIAKYEGRPWFWVGTLSFIVINSGISMVGTSVVYRVQLVLEQKKEEVLDSR